MSEANRGEVYETAYPEFRLSIGSNWETMSIHSQATSCYKLFDAVELQIHGGDIKIPDWLQTFEVSLEESTPDIILRSQAPTNQAVPVRFITHNLYGYTMDHLVFYDKQSEVMRINMLATTSAVEVICRNGRFAEASLEQLLHLAAIQNAFLPLHAATVQLEERTALISGFPHSGKTSLLLSFLNNGGYLISDDWTYVDARQRSFGLPLPITLRAWQINQLPDLLKDVSGYKKMVKRRFYTTSQFIEQTFKGKLGAKTAGLFENRSNLTLPPAALSLLSSDQDAPKIDVVYLPISHDSETIKIEPVEQETGLSLLHQIQLTEWSDFLRLIDIYGVIADSDLHPLFRMVESKLETMIHERFQDVPMFRIYHPRPVNLQSLFTHVYPHHKQIG